MTTKGSTASFDFTGYTKTATMYAAHVDPKAAFKARSLDPYLDPSTFMIRESRNNVNNPKSTPIILGVDVTGSMGSIAHEIVKTGLGVLITEINSRKPVSDPHIMFMAVGDAVARDEAPLQVSQFETGLEIVEQLDMVYVEGNGGCNNYESYNLPWHFAAYHTSADAFEKDGRKGFIFTMGDEGVPPDLTADDLQRVYKRGQEPLATNEELLTALASKYHVFHLIIEQGGHMRFRADGVRKEWAALLGQRAIPVADFKNISEIVISTMQVVSGTSVADVVNSWSGNTSVVVAKAVSGLSAVAPVGGGGGLVRI